MSRDLTHYLFETRFKYYQTYVADFLKQITAGLLIFVLLVPGIAQHLGIFFQFITTPFKVINKQSEPIHIQAAYLLSLYLVFAIWSIVQKKGILGGDFRLFLKSQPISKLTGVFCDLSMLIISNHFLWLVLLASFFEFTQNGISHFTFIDSLERNFNLVLLLITFQYLLVFELKRNILYLLIISSVFLIEFEQSLKLIQELIVFLGLFVLYWKKLFSTQNNYDSSINNLFNFNYFARGINLQILLKQNTGRFIFRFLVISLIALSYILFATKASESTYGNKQPFYIIFESMLCFFISGYFIYFKEQRRSISEFLSSLPVTFKYWLLKDLIPIILISLIVHSLILFFIINSVNATVILGLFLYHLFLLMMSYPIRMLCVKSTAYSFAGIFSVSVFVIIFF